MDQDEAMFGTEVTISNPKQEKPKKNINLTKWFALGLGGVFGLSHIGMIGMISRKNNCSNHKSTCRTLYIIYDSKQYQRRDIS